MYRKSPSLKAPPTLGIVSGRLNPIKPINSKPYGFGFIKAKRSLKFPFSAPDLQKPEIHMMLLRISGVQGIPEP